MHQNTPFLTENKTLTTIAYNYVTYLALNNLFVSSSYPKLGENIGYMQTSCQIDLSKSNCSQYAYDFISKWYNTRKYYNYNKIGFVEEAAHFTSLIWAYIYFIVNYFLSISYISKTLKNKIDQRFRLVVV